MGSQIQQYDQSPEVWRQRGGLEVHQAQAYPKNIHDSSTNRYPGPEPECVDHKCKTEHQIPFGLRPLAFGGLVALATLIVVGAAVGGGLGSALANRINRQNAAQGPSTVTKTITASSSPTSSSSLYNNFAPPDPTNVVSLATVCPEQNNQQYTTKRSEIFTYSCGEYFVGGDPASGGGLLATYTGFVAYTVEDCIEACSNMNGYTQSLGTGPLCRAITFQPLLNQSYMANIGSNCWLFNSTGTTGADVTCINAVLQS
jgi:hypothetical protein